VKPTAFTQTDGGRHAWRIKEAKDCTVRAFALVAGVEYIDAHTACRLNGRLNCRGFVGFDSKVVKIGRLLGVELRHIRRSGTLARLLRDFPRGTLMVSVSRHAFAVVDGVVVDTHPQSPSRRIKNAWVVDGTEIAPELFTEPAPAEPAFRLW
jgi:hypothetical protein